MYYQNQGKGQPIKGHILQSNACGLDALIGDTMEIISTLYEVPMEFTMITPMM
ncbi:hypothetical protein J7W08_05755 [Methanococcoides orientis]|uniref:hypothetical protein n=1 Tax=Methanococcoides orientis TaxID=2822137 RepID=UPI001E4BAD84|nr:hypothetical protein [Methanococcoides orientis]UGV41778.1 hypothetical protein J7W08_05755 [Methanococcoides orientis]